MTFKWSSIDKALLPAFKRYLGRCFHLHKSALLLIPACKSTKKWANHQIFLVYFNYIVYLCKRKNNEIAVAQFVHQ